MSFNLLVVFRRHRIARAIVALLVLAGAAFAEYMLANVKRPVDLKDTGRFVQETIRLGQAELIIEGPESEDRILFSRDGKQNETVDVTFDPAQLREETKKLLASIGLRPPSNPARIVYKVQEPDSSAPGRDPCRTKVTLIAPLKMPDEIHIFQLDRPGENFYRRLEMTTKGAELVSTLSTTSRDPDSITLPDDSKRPPGCQFLLTVGNWDTRISRVSVKTVMARDSHLILKFNRRTTEEPPPWKDSAGLLLFDLGTPKLELTDPPLFKASSVSIKSLDPDHRTLLSAKKIADGPLLTIDDLKIGSDQIQVTIAGTGLVEIDGKPWTVNLISRIEENKLLNALLLAANATLLGWLARMVFKAPSKPAPTQTP